MMASKSNYMYDLICDDTRYQVHTYRLSPHVLQVFRNLRRYFRILCDHGIPHTFRRRKSPFDFADTAVVLLARMESAMDFKAVYAGSRFLGESPWTIFGYCDDIIAENYFDSFQDVIDHYADNLLGDEVVEYFYFRTSHDLIKRMARKHEISSNSIFGIALMVLYDCVLHCGPDADEFFDLFTNDTRDEPATMDLEEWETLRCRFLGRFGEINWRSYTPAVVCPPTPARPVRVVANLELIFDGEELLHHEKTYKTFPLKAVQAGPPRPLLTDRSRPSNDYDGGDEDDVYMYGGGA